MIYFVQRNRDGNTGLIKIGTTTNLKARLASLDANQAHHLTTVRPVKVIGVMDGGRTEEQHLHERFKEHRQAGEWFRPTEEILCYVRENAHPWSGKDETEIIKIDADIARIIRVIALSEDITVIEYLNRVLRPLVEDDARKLGMKLLGITEPDDRE